MSSPPVTPPKANPAVWWILGILGGGVVVLVLVGLAAAGLILRHIDVRNGNSRVEIQTPVGEVQLSKDQSNTTGLPVYPGAKRATRDGMVGGSADISLGGEAVGIAAERYESGDSPDAVERWYRNHLGPSFRLEKGQEARSRLDSAQFDLGDADWAFVDDRGEATGLVALKRIASGTEITLLRAGKREAQ